MSTKIIIEKVEWNNGKLLLSSNSDVDEALTPTGRMLADSKRLAFIYILETSTDYMYVSISREYWRDLQKAITDRSTVMVVFNNQKLELVEIVEELLYLSSNIKGNANYGDEMVNEVEKIFLGTDQSTK
ncbi:hypothetical protein ACOI1C_08120 [Bacillus sp. DJP31]|uniref:UPF0738 family protein n=1 Tax=Bacillus sp. DJP31 TaxID=3409789 RepID=UPI003BB7AD32